MTYELYALAAGLLLGALAAILFTWESHRHTIQHLRHERDHYKDQYQHLFAKVPHLIKNLQSLSDEAEANHRNFQVELAELQTTTTANYEKAMAETEAKFGPIIEENLRLRRELNLALGVTK